MGAVAVVACCDTKYHEITFVKKAISDAGHVALVVDISTGPSVPFEGDIPRKEILKEGGFDFEVMRKSFDKSGCIDAMSKSVGIVMERLHREGRIDAVLGMGGLQNTVMCSAAFRRLPLGFPKLIVSTIASGYRYFDSVVGDKDIMVMPSIVDFCGMNMISEGILSNAVAAVIGMVERGRRKLEAGRRYVIGTTLMGITNDTVIAAADNLSEMGYEVISYHSTGLGGRVLEQMIRDGSVKAVMDLTLHELAAEYFGDYGYCKGALNRLCAGAEAGIPMLVCPGGIDFIALRKDELFDDEEERGYVWHNSELTHTKLYENEILDITRTIVERLNKARGRVELVLPMGGLRTLSYEGEPFYKPETIRKMKCIFEEGLKPEILFKCVPYNFMDKEFATFVTQEMAALLKREKENGNGISV